MNAPWPDTLRTIAFVYAQAMDAEQLEAFYCSPGLVQLLGAAPPATDGGGMQAAAEALAEEYTRLFVGPHHHFPPTEGLARRDGELLGAHAMAVKKAYEDAGVELRRDNRLLPDHLSNELDFLAALMEREEWESARDFVRSHLLAWVPDWVDAFTRRAHLSHYPAVGRLLCECLTEIEREVAPSGQHGHRAAG